MTTAATRLMTYAWCPEFHDSSFFCCCRQQLTVNKSASSHEIASLTRELEQQKLQNRAERCDANTNVQKLQEQTSELAAVVKRLEQACLHSAAPTHVQQAFTGHTHHNSMPQPFQNQPQHPAYTNWQQHDGIGANIHSGKFFCDIKYISMHCLTRCEKRGNVPPYQRYT